MINITKYFADFISGKTKYDDLPYEIRHNINFAKMVVEHDEIYYRDIPYYLKNNIKFHKDIICRNIKYDSLPNNIKYDIDFAKNVVDFNSEFYKELPYVLRDREDISVIAIRKNMYNIKYASRTLKRNEDFVIKSLDIYKYHNRIYDIGDDPNIYFFLPNSIKSDKKLIMSMLKRNYKCYKAMPQIIKNIYYVTLYVVKKDWRYIKYIKNENLLDNNEIMYHIVNNYGFSIHFYKSDQNILDNTFNDIIKYLSKRHQSIWQLFINKKD